MPLLMVLIIKKRNRPVVIAKLGINKNIYIQFNNINNFFYIRIFGI